MARPRPAGAAAARRRRLPAADFLARRAGGAEEPRSEARAVCGVPGLSYIYFFVPSHLRPTRLTAHHAAQTRACPTAHSHTVRGEWHTERADVYIKLYGYARAARRQRARKCGVGLR